MARNQTPISLRIDNGNLFMLDAEATACDCNRNRLINQSIRAYVQLSSISRGLAHEMTKQERQRILRYWLIKYFPTLQDLI